MNELLANPKIWLILGCLGALVLGLNLSLIGLLRHDKTVAEEASKWGKALRGGREGQKRQEAQIDELHRLVANLPPPPAPHSNSNSNSNSNSDQT